MKKKIILIISIILVVAIVIAGLIFFLNKNKDNGEQSLTPGPEVTDSVPTDTPEMDDPIIPDPTIPDYLDMYQSYTDLAGVSFNVPKSIMAEAEDHKEVIGSLNGKTVLYETDNTFGIKKIGSFIMGVSFYENPGVFDAIYVSSITGQNNLKITDDMNLNFKDINFNSTSFTSKKVDANQKVAVISLRMVEPEYTQDTYKGYMVLAVNSKNQGYMMFIATTESEYMMVDIQSMVNSFILTGDTLTSEVKPTSTSQEDGTISLIIRKPDFSLQAALAYIRNVDNKKLYIANLSSNNAILQYDLKLEAGNYQISVLWSDNGTYKPITLNRETFPIESGKITTVPGALEVNNNSSLAFIYMAHNYQDVEDGYTLNVDVLDSDGNVVGTLNTPQREGTIDIPDSLELPAGTYTFKGTFNGNDMDVDIDSISVEKGNVYIVKLDGMDNSAYIKNVETLN